MPFERTELSATWDLPQTGGLICRCRDHAMAIRAEGGVIDMIATIVSGSIFAWRWSFQMQAVNMSDQFSFRGPSTEVEAKHLICPLGRCSSDPQADQQARNTGCIHLEAHPVDPLAQQMPAAQHTFDPAEKQLDVIVTTHKTIGLVFHTQV